MILCIVIYVVFSGSQKVNVFIIAFLLVGQCFVHNFLQIKQYRSSFPSSMLFFVDCVCVYASVKDDTESSRVSISTCIKILSLKQLFHFRF